MRAPRNIIRFGDFTLDGDTRQLIKAGQEIHLSPKAFEMLLLLVRNRPRALSKADLQERLWPDTFVTESNIHGLITEIRHALGDQARQGGFVRTLHGFGYAFTADADEPTEPDRPPRTSDATFWIIADSQIRLVEGENILGRDPEARVWFDRPGVSRLHARIVVAGDDATLEDLGSTNGTWVRGERVEEPISLRDGDEIRLGPAVVTFRIRRAMESTEIAQ
ncbi:MAG TPA: FHA domain-containing protein [Vicinamibacterales bacterium]|nr:FHA domain-containing protein [Vicinamibacterales bacterium]